MEADQFHVAQLNVARPKAPVDSPLLADFANLLDPVNALADAAPGFVWRLQDGSGNATSIPVLGDTGLIVNMSVWASVEALWQFVYSADHLAVMRRRREWFKRMDAHFCLWWVPAGHRPSVHEAEERLLHLRAHGPCARAFTFKRRFAPTGGPLDEPAVTGV